MPSLPHRASALWPPPLTPYFLISPQPRSSWDLWITPPKLVVYEACWLRSWDRRSSSSSRRLPATLHRLKPGMPKSQRIPVPYPGVRVEGPGLPLHRANGRPAAQVGRAIYLPWHHRSWLGPCCLEEQWSVEVPAVFSTSDEAPILPNLGRHLSLHRPKGPACLWQPWITKYRGQNVVILASLN